MIKILKKTSVFFIIYFFWGIAGNAADQKIPTFDLLGVDSKVMLQGRVKSDEKVKEVLAKRNLELSALTGRSRVIFYKESKKLLLELGNSETEGFWFTLSTLEREIKEASQDKETQAPQTKNILLEPLSENYPSVHFGMSSGDLIELLGKPNYFGADPNDEGNLGLTEAIWILKRDKEKEKSCFGAIQKKPPFEAMQVIFTFDVQKKLKKIGFYNWISGEC